MPAGPFLMGSSDAEPMADADEKPQHGLILPAFRIGRYAVTNGLYRRFVEATGRGWRSFEADRPERATCPAVYVSWHDARAYCEWLTGVWSAEGRIGPDEEVRLPTEAEWEKAARGDDGRIWPWGDVWNKTKCNNQELGVGDTTPVGMFPQGKGPYGCLDMAGNVWEWTRSLLCKEGGEGTFAYPYDPRDGRENLEAGDDFRRVVRGGSFYRARRDARCAFRFRLVPHGVWPDIGFRVAVSPSS